jgi:hypothetical protein
MSRPAGPPHTRRHPLVAADRMLGRDLDRLARRSQRAEVGPKGQGRAPNDAGPREGGSAAHQECAPHQKLLGMLSAA